MRALKKTGKIVLVGNYFSSTNDPTPVVVKEITESHSQIQAVIREKGLMMGWDMRSGLYATKGKYVAVIDEDGQMPLKDVARVYKKNSSKAIMIWLKLIELNEMMVFIERFFPVFIIFFLAFYFLALICETLMRNLKF